MSIVLKATFHLIIHCNTNRPFLSKKGLDNVEAFLRSLARMSAYALPIDLKALLSGAGITATTARMKTDIVRRGPAIFQNMGEPCALHRTTLDEYLVLTGAVRRDDR